MSYSHPFLSPTMGPDSMNESERVGYSCIPYHSSQPGVARVFLSRVNPSPRDLRADSVVRMRKTIHPSPGDNPWNYSETKLGMIQNGSVFVILIPKESLLAFPILVCVTECALMGDCVCKVPPTKQAIKATWFRD